MSIPLFICFSFFLISMNAFSETHVLLIDSGKSTSAGYVRVYNNVREGYDVAQLRGLKTKVLSIFGKKKGEEFPISDPPIVGQLRDANDIGKAIKSLNPGKDDTVLIYITGQSTAHSKWGDPSTASIATKDYTASYEEIAKALEKLPKNIKIKIAGNTGFSGGIHHIARALSNVCTVATVGYYHRIKGNGDSFNKGFWAHLKAKGKNTSFAEMSIAGLRKDEHNVNTGNLSSWDYVDFISEKGNYENLLPPTVVIGDINIFNNSHSVLFSTSVFPPAEKINIQGSTQVCKTGDCDSDSILSNVENLNDLSKILERIETKPLDQSLRDQLNTLPKQTQSVFHEVIEDMKKNGENYEKIASDYNNQYNVLKKEWDSYFKKRWDKDKDNKRAEFQAKVDALQKKAQGNSDLRRYAFNRQMLDRLGRLDKFSRVATAGQKQKFMQLLNCEWEPI